MSATYVLTIAGATKVPRANTLSITRASGAVHAATFQVTSDDGSYSPAIDAEVILTENGTRVFAGYVVTVRKVGLIGFGLEPLANEVVAHDYNIISRRVTVSGTLPSQTVKVRLTTAVAALSSYGVTLHASQIDGVTLEARDYDAATVEQVILDALQESGYVGRIDYSKVLRARAVGSDVCPFDVIDNGIDGDGHALGDVEVEQSRSDLYANRIIVKAGTGTKEQTQAFVADGVATSWPVDLPSVPVSVYWPGVVILNGVSVPIGPYENPTIGAASFYALQWDPVTHAIYQRTGDAPLVNGTTLSIIYTAQYPFTHIVEDAAEIAAHGLTEYILVVPSAMDLAAADAAGLAELAVRIVQYERAIYQTHELGALPGQAQLISFPTRSLSGWFLLEQVDTRDENGEILVTTVHAVQGTKVRGTFRKTYEKWIEAGQGAGASPTTSSGTASNAFPGGTHRDVQWNEQGVFAGNSGVRIDKDPLSQQPIALVVATGTPTTPVDTTGANFLVAFASSGLTPTTIINDSYFNVWVPLTDQTISSQHGQLFYVENAVCGPNHSWNGNGSFGDLVVAAFSGVKLVGSFDQENGAAATGASSIQPGSVTPTENNELVVVGVAYEFADFSSINGGFTTAATCPTSSAVGATMAYLIQTAAAAANPTASFTAPATLCAPIATFKVASVSTGIPYGVEQLPARFSVGVPDEDALALALWNEDDDTSLQHARDMAFTWWHLRNGDGAYAEMEGAFNFRNYAANADINFGAGRDFMVSVGNALADIAAFEAVTQISGLSMAQRRVTANHTLDTTVPDGAVLCDASSGAFTVTFPALSSALVTTATDRYRIYTFKNIGTANVVTLDADSAEVFYNGVQSSLTLKLYPGQWCIVQARTGTGAGWHVLASNLNSPLIYEFVMTDAQLKAAPSTPVTVLPAFGANIRTHFDRVDVRFDFSAGAYTNVDAAAYGWLQHVTSNAVASNHLANDAAITRAYFDLVFTNATKRVVPFFPWVDTVETSQWGNLAVPIVQGDMVNQGLEWVVDNGGSGNFTGGNSGNTATFRTSYRYEDAP